MEIRSYKPQSASLTRFIKCFYTLKRAPEESSVTYVSFPGFYSMVCLNANARVKVCSGNLTISHTKDIPVETSLVVNFDEPGNVNYQGETDEIVIYFKPLGLNAFLENDLKDYVTAPCTQFAPFENYRAKMKEIFSLDGDKNRIAALENYWLRKLKGFRHPFLHGIIKEMTGSENSQAITALAQKKGISRMTLNKHFDRHLCTTPSQFKKVARFRKSMKQHRRRNIQRENLTVISHAAEYFDQSHMVKDFRSLTNFSPRTFFSKISQFEEGQINWLFL